MARPLKWSRDLHPIRERASHSRTETWSRQDMQDLFGIGVSSAQTVMKAVGQVATVGGAHFVERSALLAFLDQMIQVPSVEEEMRLRLAEAEPVPRPKTLRITLPPDLRNAMMPDLPSNIVLEPGRLEVRAESALAMLESLVTLAMVMQNDLDRFQAAIEPRSTRAGVDDELRSLFTQLRSH